MNQSKSKFVKIGCTLLALLIFLAMFAACNTKTPTNPADPNSTPKETVTAPVPHYDWKERRFDVLSVNNTYEPNIEIEGDIAGSLVAKEAYDRNQWLEEYYNVEIKQHKLGALEKPFDKLTNIQQAGDHNYDLVFLIRGDMSRAVTGGLMTDLMGVQYLDFSHDWYNSNTIESMKIGDKLFHMASDFSLVDKARTNVLFYNRDLGDEYSLPDLIQLVRDGEWTIEKMVEYTKSYDLNGDSIIDISDKWGMTCGGKEAAAVFWSALGNKVVSFNESGNWSIDVASTRSQNSVEKLTKLFKDDISFNGGAVKQNGKVEENWSAPSNTFTVGRALFMSNCLSSIINIGKEATFSYTVLPYPKLDVEQKQYITTNDNVYTATFGIPTTAAEPDFSAFMVEVLSWKSSTTTFPAYYEIVCKSRSTYDDDCAEMLDLVFNGVTFDFGLMYGTGEASLKTGVIMESIYDGSRDISVLYADKQTIAETAVENLLNAVELLGSVSQ